MTHLRKPRFQRAPEIAPIQLTERDRMIVRCVFQHRFLRSWQIAALVGGSKQAVLRRLQLLYHHGYLERPRAQIEYFQPGGSRAFVYGLADRGAELLRLTENPSLRALEWSAKNRAVKRLFLEHALLVSDVMVSLELACRQHGGVRFLKSDELPLPAATRSRLEPFRWKVSLNGGTRLGVVPDCVFGLEFADQPPDRNRAYFFLEADRGTMPIARNGLHHSSFHRKLLAYEASKTRSRLRIPTKLATNSCKQPGLPRGGRRRVTTRRQLSKPPVTTPTPSPISRSIKCSNSRLKCETMQRILSGLIGHRARLAHHFLAFHSGVMT